MKNKNGQIILILLLVMSVALAIGLSIVQRSFVDVSTSTKIEQSTRAFSAAEAGIEIAKDVSEAKLQNSTLVNVVDSGLLPRVNQAVEYPPVGKEGIIHVWLADPNDDPANIQEYYKKSSLAIYWGTSGIGILNSSENAPALEIIIVSVSNDNKTYSSKKILLDSKIGRSPNSFTTPGGSSANINVFTCDSPSGVKTIFGDNRQFKCRTQLVDLIPQGSKLVLLRARFIYTSTTHPFAVMPEVGNECRSEPLPNRTDCSLPPQVRLVQSQGTSGQTQRTIQLFQILKVVPFYFDYAIFASGDIEK